MVPVVCRATRHSHPQRCVVTGCEVPACTRTAAITGLCWGHYSRRRKYGDVMADVPVGDLSHVVCRTCEESEWARDNAVTPQEVARSLGVKALSMVRHFQRQGRDDLAAWARDAANAEARHHKKMQRERDHATD